MMNNFKNRIIAELKLFSRSPRLLRTIWRRFSFDSVRLKARHAPCSTVIREADGRRRERRWTYSSVTADKSGAEEGPGVSSAVRPASWKGTSMDSARQSTPERRRSRVRQPISTLVLHCVLLVVVAGIVGPAVAASGPVWTIGRAVVQPAKEGSKGHGLVVKLSLRNEGKPGEGRVQILGRWKPGPEDLTPLRRLKKEVALKQTAIVVISLEPLEDLPPGKPSVELVVMTDARETDRKTIRLP